MEANFEQSAEPKKREVPPAQEASVTHAQACDPAVMQGPAHCSGSSTQDVQVLNAASGIRKLSIGDRPRKTAKYFKERKRARKAAKIAAGTWVEGPTRRKKKVRPEKRSQEGTTVHVQAPSHSGQGRSETVKRPRSENSTPSSSAVKPPAKRPRQTEREGLSYAERLTTTRMAVAPMGYPESRLSEEEALQVQRIIYTKVKVLSNGFYPQCLDCKTEAGVLVMNCANAETKEWLMETVALVGFLGNIRLMAGEAKKILNNKKAITKLPRLMDTVKVEQVLQDLEKANAQIKTTEWRVLSCSTEPDGRTLVVSLSEMDCAELRKRNCKLFLGFEQIRFKILEKPAVEERSRTLENGPEGNSSQSPA